MTPCRSQHDVIVAYTYEEDDRICVTLESEGEKWNANVIPTSTAVVVS